MAVPEEWDEGVDGLGGGFADPAQRPGRGDSDICLVMSEEWDEGVDGGGADRAQRLSRGDSRMRIVTHKQWDEGVDGDCRSHTPEGIDRGQSDSLILALSQRVEHPRGGIAVIEFAKLPDGPGSGLQVGILKGGQGTANPPVEGGRGW